jgi:outer membrane protein assembly factor BamA
VVNNPIFDESDPDAFFIHRWANSLHINTKEYVVLDNLTFSENDTVTQKDLDESQRLLRAVPYIRDAKIYVAEKDPQADVDPTVESVVVETWDNWSLLPTASLSSSGGDTRYSFGIKEDNLLGTGIRTRLKYQSNESRNGYKFAFEAPLSIIEHGKLAADFYDNSDGQAKHLYVSKPFYSLDTKTMYSAEFLDDNRIDTLRQNGQDVSEFEHAGDYLNLQYGWLIDNNSEHLSRLITGFTQDKHEFRNIETYPNANLPQDRDFMYPWVAYEFIQDDFHVLNNVHLITNNEDFNLGWHHFMQLGLETNDIRDNSPLGYHFNWRSSGGYKDDNQLWLFAVGGNSTLGTSQKDNYKLDVQAEYFYQINPKWTAYAKVRASTSQNTYLDLTQGLGDETGVRGYPNDYQQGDDQWLVTAEIRNYPNINLYQLAELGWAVFTDLGQATGGPLADNNEVSDPLGSIGIGARIYSSRSSYGNVAHIDFSVPYSGGESVNSWEWRFLVKRSF